jgi:hypothetical protein
MRRRHAVLNRHGFGVTGRASVFCHARARAKLALTNEAEADHYARAAEHSRLAKTGEEFGFQKADVAIGRGEGSMNPEG